MICAENLVKGYDGHTVLDGLNFTVEEGDLFGFLGPSGAGKTTTIRILAAVLQPAPGNLISDGYDVFAEPHSVKRIVNALPKSNGYYE